MVGSADAGRHILLKAARPLGLIGGDLALGVSGDDTLSGNDRIEGRALATIRPMAAPASTSSWVAQEMTNSSAMTVMMI